AQLALTARSIELWRAFAAADGRDMELEHTGTLWIAEDAAQFDALGEKQRVYAAAGIGADILDEQQLREAERNLRPGLAGALRVGDDAVVYPPAAALALLDRARALGAHVMRAGVT